MLILSCQFPNWKLRWGKDVMQVIERLFAGKKLVLYENIIGNDLILICYGGDQPHVGAIALAQPYCDLSGKNTVSVSIISALGHKDSLIAYHMAERVAKALQCTVSAVCGIHYDGISHEDIAMIIDLCKQMVEEYLEHKA